MSKFFVPDPYYVEVPVDANTTANSITTYIQSADPSRSWHYYFADVYTNADGNRVLKYNPNGGGSGFPEFVDVPVTGSLYVKVGQQVSVAPYAPYGTAIPIP